MSQLQTIKSNSRPTSPVEGSVFYETDTKRILIYAQGTYHVYNRDSLSYSTGGTDELNYPQGLYFDSEAQYYVDKTPLFHIDASHIDGVTKDAPSGSDSWLQYIYDRTNAKYEWKEMHGGVDAVLNTTQSSTLSNGENITPCIQDNGCPYTPQGGAPTSTSGHQTLFAVIQPNNTNKYVTIGPYSSWYTNHGTANIMFGYNVGSWLNLKDVTNTTGPGLYIARNGPLGLQNWRVGDNDPAAITLPYFGGSASLATFGHTYNQFFWEVILFQDALSIAQVNIVKDYLQSKYVGLNDDYFPTGGTVPLTESV